jgi:hypothetical protein
MCIIGECTSDSGDAQHKCAAMTTLLLQTLENVLIHLLSILYGMYFRAVKMCKHFM